MRCGEAAQSKPAQNGAARYNSLSGSQLLQNLIITALIIRLLACIIKIACLLDLICAHASVILSIGRPQLASIKWESDKGKRTRKEPDSSGCGAPAGRAAPANSEASSRNLKADKKATRKRPSRRGRSGSPGDGNNDKDGRNEKKARRDKTLPFGRSWACPFNKLQPNQHPDCRRYKFSRIADVRQHVVRVHTQPVHCPRCGQLFEGDSRTADRDNHVRAATCPLRSPSDFELPGANPDQINTMKLNREANPPHAADRDERLWYGIFCALFPGEPWPRSPYYEISEHIDSINEDIHSYIAGSNMQTYLNNNLPSQLLQDWPGFFVPLFTNFLRDFEFHARQRAGVLDMLLEAQPIEQPAGPVYQPSVPSQAPGTYEAQPVVPQSFSTDIQFPHIPTAPPPFDLYATEEEESFNQFTDMHELGTHWQGTAEGPS